MAYSLKIKKEVLEKLQQGSSIMTLSRMYNISRHMIRYWRDSPDHYLDESRTACRFYDLDQKVEVLHMVEEGDLSISQIAELKGINPGTIRNWIRDKSHILAVYSSQEQHLMNDDLSIRSGEEAKSMSTADDKDIKQHNRDLRNENEFLKAKVAYLEALMELNGTPVSSFKKKANIKPSAKSSKEKSET